MHIFGHSYRSEVRDKAFGYCYRCDRPLSRIEARDRSHRCGLNRFRGVMHCGLFAIAIFCMGVAVVAILLDVAQILAVLFGLWP